MIRVVQTLLLLSTLLLSTACSTSYGPGIECKRPNDIQKKSWKFIMDSHYHDSLYYPGLSWMKEVQEEDCFSDEAAKIRKESDKKVAKRWYMW